jgi:hypothetical protein
MAVLPAGALAQTLGENHVTGTYPETAAFTQAPNYLAPAGADGTLGTLDDEHIPQNAYRADPAFVGDEINLYGEALDPDDPAMGAAGAIGTPLPVELAEASLQLSGGTVPTAQIRFAVYSETNNAGFTVDVNEAASDGNASGGDASNSGAPGDSEADAAQWTSIAEIEGRGTTNQPKTYTATDTKLDERGPKLHYRVVQTDLDGTREVIAELEAENPYRQEAGVRAWPNPTAGAVTVQVAGPEQATEAEVALYDLLGRRVQQRTVRLREGQARTNWTLEVPSGTYVLRMTTEAGATYTRRLTVVR